jgi:hypothetical protein
MIGTEEAEEWSRVQALEPGGRVKRRPSAELVDGAYHLVLLGRQASPARWQADGQLLTAPSLP